MDAKANHFSKALPVALLFHIGTASAEVGLTPYSTIPTGSRAETVAIADLNNDGRNDVVVNTSYNFDVVNDYKLKVFYQDQNGQLQSPVDHPLIAEYSKRPQSLVTGDFNNDNLTDVAIGFDRGYIQIFTQKSDGSLALSDTIQTLHSTRIAVGDLNADGLDDIAGIAWGGLDAGIFYQTSSGIQHQPAIHHAPHGGYDDMVIGDINGDNADDLVVMSGQGYAYSNLAVLTSDGNGDLSPVTFYDLGGNELTRGVAIGDFDRDGRNDVAVTFGGNSPFSNIAIFQQGIDGSLMSPEVSSSYDIPESLITADLNHDDRDDLLVLHGGWNTLGVYEQASTNTLIEEQLFDIPYASHYNPQGIDTGDINGDGINDVVVADYNNGLVVLHGTVSTPLSPPLAHAGADVTIQQNLYVELTGSQSLDSDGVIVEYSWKQTAGIPVQLNGASNSESSFVAPILLAGEAATLVFELSVTDNDGLLDTDSVIVNINANSAPNADAGMDQIAPQRRRVTLDGAASADPDGTISTYQWTQTSGTLVSLDDSNTALASFVTPKLKRKKTSILMFDLIVTDNLGQSSTDSVVITVKK
ncbi:MAG: FG-GAP-like repeat-containing protein [Halopseudomonas sp.]